MTIMISGRRILPASCPRHKVEELIKSWKMTIKNNYKFNAKAGLKYINRFVDGGKYIVSGMRQRIDF